MDNIHGVSLARYAIKSGYTVLTGDGWGADKYPFCHLDRMMWDFPVDGSPLDALEEGGLLLSDNNDVQEEIENLNARTSRHGKRKLLVIKSEASFEDFKTKGLLSKAKRLSRNGEDFQILQYPVDVDWRSVLQSRISGTRVDIRALLARPKDAKGLSTFVKGNVICQRSQYEAAEEFLRHLLHLIRARTALVLSGGFGIGKSVLLERARLVLMALEEGKIVTYDQWRDLRNILKPPQGDFTKGVHVVDDGFARGGEYQTAELLAKRPPFIAATNVEKTDIMKILDPQVEDRLFTNGHVVELPGEDYSSGNVDDSDLIRG